MSDKHSDGHGKPGGKPDPHETIVIHIDDKKRNAPKPVMTGTELRTLGSVADNRTLWQVVPGGEDNLVDTTEPIDLKNGMHFYSVATTVGEG